MLLVSPSGHMPSPEGDQHDAEIAPLDPVNTELLRFIRRCGPVFHRIDKDPGFFQGGNNMRAVLFQVFVRRGDECFVDLLRGIGFHVRCPVQVKYMKLYFYQKSGLISRDVYQWPSALLCKLNDSLLFFNFPSFIE
jgi:hypothetical protein